MEPADAGGEQRAEAAAFALEALEAQCGEEKGEGEGKRAGHERRWARGEAADEQCAKAQLKPREGFGEQDKQSGVGGRVGGPKVVLGLDQSAAEELFPDPVGHDPRGKWMTWFNQPVCQGQSSPGFS